MLEYIHNGSGQYNACDDEIFICTYIHPGPLRASGEKAVGTPLLYDQKKSIRTLASKRQPCEVHVVVTMMIVLLYRNFASTQIDIIDNRVSIY